MHTIPHTPRRWGGHKWGRSMAMGDMVEKVAKAIADGVHPWAIMSKGLAATRQRTYCPFCQVQLVEWGDHSKTCEARLPVARAALDACHHEELVEALNRVIEDAPEAEPEEPDFMGDTDAAVGYGMMCMKWECAEIARAVLAKLEADHA